MPSALEEAWWGAGRTGAQLPGEQQTTFRGTVGYTGPGDIYNRREFQAGRKAYKKTGKQFGDYLSALAGSISAADLAPKLKQKFEQKGYKEFEGYYTTKVPTADVISSVSAQGFGESDLQKYIADRFTSKYVNQEVQKFMGSGWKMNPDTGKYEAVNSTITVPTGTGVSGISTSISGTVVPSGTVSGIYAGLDPDKAKGYNPNEMLYASIVDPYKLQAKSAERIAKLGQGTALYGLIGNVI